MQNTMVSENKLFWKFFVFIHPLSLWKHIIDYIALITLQLLLINPRTQTIQKNQFVQLELLQPRSN